MANVPDAHPVAGKKAEKNLIQCKKIVNMLIR